MNDSPRSGASSNLDDDDLNEWFHDNLGNCYSRSLFRFWSFPLITKLFFKIIQQNILLTNFNIKRYGFIFFHHFQKKWNVNIFRTTLKPCLERRLACKSYVAPLRLTTSLIVSNEMGTEGDITRKRFKFSTQYCMVP